jgi:predicted ATPase
MWADDESMWICLRPTWADDEFIWADDAGKWAGDADMTPEDAIPRADDVFSPPRQGRLWADGGVAGSPPRANAAERAPKERRHVAWGVSPRSERPTHPGAPKGRQITVPPNAAVAPSGLLASLGPANLGLTLQATCLGSFGAPKRASRKWAPVPIESVPMEGKKLLHSITLKNLLSYGSEGVTLDLEPLNVLIGPNASGKSNLIEAISLLAAAPRDLLKPLREGGGTSEWIWKGMGGSGTASVGVLVEYQDLILRYAIEFAAANYRFKMIDEKIFPERWRDANDERPPVWQRVVYDYNKGSPKLKTRLLKEGSSAVIITSKLNDLDSEQSVLSQVRGADVYPELTYLATSLGRISFFREWGQGRLVAPRSPQKADLPQDFLLEDASNLGLVLNDLQHRPATKRLIIERLKLFYQDIEDVTTKLHDGTVQVFFHESGLNNFIPASRLSDGTLHYLCLLTILLHPDPPPLICIEEPELGLHPDIIPKIAELLIDASKRTQLIVTTHSETLVSALSEVPEAVVVCERDDRGTQLRRLDPENLKEWLDRYRLGDLWAKGEIGGNRW